MGSAAEKVRRKLGTAYEEIWDKHPELKDELERMWTDADKKKYHDGFLEGAEGLRRAAEEIGLDTKMKSFWEKVPPEFRKEKLPTAAHDVWGSEEGIQARIELSRAVIAADIPKLYRKAMKGEWDYLNREVMEKLPEEIKRELGFDRITNAQQAYKAIAAFKKLGDVLRKTYGKQT